MEIRPELGGIITVFVNATPHDQLWARLIGRIWFLGNVKILFKVSLNSLIPSLEGDLLVPEVCKKKEDKVSQLSTFHSHNAYSFEGRHHDNSKDVGTLREDEGKEYEACWLVF